MSDDLRRGEEISRTSPITSHFLKHMT